MQHKQRLFMLGGLVVQQRITGRRIVWNEMQTILGIKIPFKPRVFLLHDLSALTGKVQRHSVLFGHMSMAVSLVTESNWKWFKTPSLQEWKQNMYFLFLMVKLSASSKSKAGNMKALSMFQE